jgi:hypothetical protein
MISFAFNLLGLLVPGLWLGHKLRLPLLSSIGASFIIFETSLVFGAGLLSWAELLGNERAYQATTTLFAFGLALGLWLISRTDILTNERSVEKQRNSSTRAASAISVASAVILATLVVWFGLDWLQSWTALALYLKLYKILTMFAALGIVGLAAFFAWYKNGISARAICTSFSRESLMVSGSIAILAIFAVLMLWLALNAYPNVEDSVTIKLQKAVFAIETNSFLPTSLTDDGRMFMSPPYPALLQLFFIINGQKSHALLVFGFVNWALCGAALYGICRCGGVSKLSCWIALVLVLLSPTMIIQGTSEGDDILVATPFVLSLLFFLTWTHSGRRLDAVLAGLGLGLAVGIKLFPLFYLPAIPLILLLAIYKYKIPLLLEWLRAKAAGGLLVLAGFIFALLPHAIANWVAFGSPFYVSASLLVTRNSPFSLDCALRDTAGYMKQFLFSDLLRLLARAMVSSSEPAHESYVSNIDKYNKFFSTVLPFDPTPACSAWDQFIVTAWHPNDNTFWFGILGPLLLFSCIVAMAARGQPLATRSLGIGFLVWLIAFAFIQKYIAWIGRYWSLPVLAASPVVAVILDRLIERGRTQRASLLLVLPAAVLTVALGWNVLTTNTHRSLGQAMQGGPKHDFFPAELRSVMNKAASVNIQLIYGIDTYDYYLMLSPGAKILNKSSILDNSLNYALVRPYGVTSNPFADPRIAVRMNKPFAHGFRYFGQVPMGFGFANNTELAEHNGIDPRSVFLLFQVSVRQEGSSIAGTVLQIADEATISNVKYRIGWRDPAGNAVVSGAWKQGLSADFKVPADASALIIQAAFIDAEGDVAAMEWPMSGDNSVVIAKLK